FCYPREQLEAVSKMVSGVQFLEQGLGLFQIELVETFRKPAVNRSEQFASLLRFPVVTIEARYAHRCAEFPGDHHSLQRRRFEATSNYKRRARRDGQFSPQPFTALGLTSNAAVLLCISELISLGGLTIWS